MSPYSPYLLRLSRVKVLLTDFPLATSIFAAKSQAPGRLSTPAFKFYYWVYPALEQVGLTQVDFRQLVYLR